MINCPRCGATNPVENRFCGKCGQVLSASGMLDHSPKPDADLPDWLQESGGDSGSSFSGQQPGATPPVPAQSELPAWLSEIGVEDEHRPASETAQAPDWLAQLQQAPSDPSAAEDLPAWLRSNDEPPATSTSAPASSQQLPDWLRELEQPAPPAAAAPSQESPGWLQADAPAAETPALSPPPAQLPDWLRELETEAPSPAPSPSSAGSDEIPVWLREDPSVSDQPPGGTGSSSRQLPDWLAEFGTAEVTSPPVNEPERPTASTPLGALPEVPNWLADFDSASASADPTPPSDPTPPWLREDSAIADAAQKRSLPGQAAPSELPVWLMGESTADANAQDLNVPLPDWSSEFGADLPPQTLQDEPRMDWLHEPDQPAAQSGSTIPLSPITPDRAPDDVPDWLREIDQPAAASPSSTSAQELPAWLAEESSATAAPTPPSQDLSAWLLDADTPALDQSPEQGETLSAWLADDGTVAGQQTQPFSMSDLGATQPLAAWLLDDPSSGSGVTQPGAQQPTQPTGELPAWLSGDDLPGSGANTYPAQASDELPAWLAGSDDPAGSASSFTQSSDELPAWLATDEPLSGAQTFNQPSDDLPPWLSGSSDAASTIEPSYGQSQSDDLPPWLAAEESASSPGVDYTQPQAGDLPAWLSAADEPAPSPVSAQQPDDLPPWLAAEEQATAVDAERVAAPEPTQSTPASDDTVTFPAWLSDSAPAQPSAPDATTDTDLPPWLSGIESEAPAKSAEPASGLPSWLDEPSQPTKPKQPAGQSEFFGGLDLPAWLREEGDPQQAAAPIKETAPDWLQKISPEADDAVVVQQQAVVAAPRVTRTPERVESMRLLEQMLSEPAPEPMPTPAKRRRSWLPLLLGLILILLVGAILFILLNPRLGLSFGAEAAPAPAVIEAAQTIDGLAAQRPVVVAYEWEAQRLGDLRPLEETIIAHLAARRDVPLVFLSTDPQGALLAAERAGQISRISDNFHDQYGLGYVNLGFKAGGPIALRQFAASDSFGALFAQDASGNDLRANDVVMQSMCGAATAEGCSWANVGLLVVIADEVEDVRGWSEQVRSQYPALPTLVLATAEIGPQVEPYAAAASTHILAGAESAEAYSRARGVQDERLGRQIDAAAVGEAIFALLIVAGGPIAVFQGYRTRREAEVEEWEQ